MDLHISLVGRDDLSGEIYRQVRRAILDGRLRPGDLLPPSRTLARRLSVARTTVTVAYDRLAGEGFVRSRMGAGTYVSEHGAAADRAPRVRPRAAMPAVLRARPLWDDIPLPTTHDLPTRFDFRTGLPDAALFPHTTWRRLMTRAMRDPAVAGGLYGHPAGHPGLRAAVARHIGISRGVEATADDIIITNGTQGAVDVVARALLAPGDCVAVEDPGYPPPRHLLVSLGLAVASVPVDREGLMVDALPPDARLVYVTPSHQYPLGIPMSLPRRLVLLAWAERHEAAILEDDYDSEFRYGGRPIEPLRSLDTAGRVIYVGSFSKTLLPGLRLGFVVSPPSLRDAVRKAKFVIDWYSSLATQAALAEFIETGGFARHLRRARTVYAERRARLIQILGDELREHLELIPSEAGLHVAALARTATVGRVRDVVRRAAASGVTVQPISRFTRGGDPAAGLMLGFGAVPAERMAPGLRLLRRCFEAHSPAEHWPVA